MWPFASTPSRASNSSSGSGAGDRPESNSLDVPEGADGIAGDVPVIAYTEKIIAEKEASLRKYIQDNYAKLHAVEKELEALRLEVKLTSGSKKAATELLRQKIEESAEKIKLARVKELQAKQAWEAAQKVVQQEEEHKATLCEDLRTMIQQSAMQQYERLENLTKKLDALNPEMRGAALSAIEGLRQQIAPHGVPVLSDSPAPSAKPEAQPAAPAPQTSATLTTPDGPPATAGEAQEATREGGGEGNPAVHSGADSGADQQQGESSREAEGRTGEHVPGKQGAKEEPKEQAGGRKGVQLKGKGRGGMVTKGQRVSGALGTGNNGGWTGAGFDVDRL